MIKIGKYNTLKVLNNTEEGLYLDGGDYGELLLPRNQVSIDDQEIDVLEVFLYCDADEKIIPTTKKPYVTVGAFASLKVIDVLAVGAFLSWGIPKDLFVPRSEQREDMIEGESYIVYVYQDKRSKRLVASSRLDSFLDKDSITFKEDDKVDLLICHQTDFGYNAIINHSHWGLLYKDEVFQDLKYGQRIEGFIKKIREDEKIDLSLQIQGYRKMDVLEEKIIAQINEQDGVLAITDKSSPESISKLFGVSKKKYKMALGSLYKSKRIVIADDGIKLK